MPIDDVPSPIDFHDRQDVQEWIQKTVRNRPWRPEFFDAYVGALNKRFNHPFSLLELGSGPGFLAEQVLKKCSVRSFVAIDFSAVMHELARHRLEPFLERITLLQRDFRVFDWIEGLIQFDAVISMQAVHEVRHKQRIPVLIAQVHQLLAGNGLFLFCDGYLEMDNPGKNPNLFLTREEQEAALRSTQFTGVECLLDKGGMALWSATKDGPMPTVA